MKFNLFGPNDSTSSRIFQNNKSYKAVYIIGSVLFISGILARHFVSETIGNPLGYFSWGWFLAVVVLGFLLQREETQKIKHKSDKILKEMQKDIAEHETKAKS